MFGFSHRTFQEYFAARGIVEEGSGGKEDPVSLLRPHLYHPRWEEVVRLVSAQLSPARATTLVRTILDDADPAGRFLRRGLRLALRCLADGAAVSERRLLDEIFSAGEVLGKSKWLGITTDVIEALLDLKVTRHTNHAGRMLQQIESAARQALSGGEYLWIHEMSHGPLWDSDRAGDTPGTVHRKRIGGRALLIVSLAPRLRRDAPEKWYTAVLRLLDDANADSSVKRVLIENLLGYEVNTNERVRSVLENVLARDRSSEVRAACAAALQRAVALHASTADRLLQRLEQDKSDNVRGECASALMEAAPVQSEIRDRLKALLSSTGNQVREGAVWGLARVALTDRQLFDLFITRARSKSEDPRVRVACLRVIEDSLGEDPAVGECVSECLDDVATPLVQRVAAQIAATALANDRWAWSPVLVEKVEAILMAVPNPCPHALRALVGLVSAKEVHGSVRLECLLGNALLSFGNRISVAFVFGSVARREQGRGSDIDLLIIGEVRLKEVVTALHAAEDSLGRTINPALYTPLSFKEKYQAGDPFLLEIARNDKLFLKGGGDELRALVAERLSH
jgi:predicted nucleotidyltransferase